ncbi:hypothetical protein BGZ90_000583 [Linnemannia elongata]|nr:hypothetical protein BGZ90_000583 [Linnemannia elongata]
MATRRKKTTTPRKKTSCPFLKCRLGYTSDSLIRAHKDHLDRYHKDITEVIGMEKAVFYVRRDPSNHYKYVCLCGSSTPNRYTFRYHVIGYPSRESGPCSTMYDMALRIVATNVACKDKTMPMNYEPLPSNDENLAEMTADEDALPETDVEIVSDIEVDDAFPESEANVMSEMAQNENDHHEEALDVDESNHFSRPDDLDINRILMDNDVALDNAIKALQKARSDIQRQQGHGPLDFSVHATKLKSYTLGVTEVKRDEFRERVAQNIVQLESTLITKKHKLEAYEIDGDEEEPKKLKSHAVVTDGAEWLFVECKLDESEKLLYKMSKLKRS